MRTIAQGAMELKFSLPRNARSPSWDTQSHRNENTPIEQLSVFYRTGSLSERTEVDPPMQLAHFSGRPVSELAICLNMNE